MQWGHVTCTVHDAPNACAILSTCTRACRVDFDMHWVRVTCTEVEAQAVDVVHVAKGHFDMHGHAVTPVSDMLASACHVHNNVHATSRQVG
jgi:hypothetical protein